MRRTLRSRREGCSSSSLTRGSRRMAADLQWLICDSWRRRTATTPSPSRAALAEPLECRRLLSAGDLDPTFGTNGTLRFPYVRQIGAETTAHAVVAQADGKVILAGSTDPRADGNTDFLLARFNADGMLDKGFGVNGTVRTDVSGGGADVAYGITLAAGGKILVVGSTTEGSETELAVARYNADGSLDTSFSGDGLHSAGYAGRAEIAYDVAVDSSGSIVLAGASNGDLLVARLNASGANDTSFSGDGLDRAGFGGIEAARGVAIGSDGKIAAAGSTTNGIGGSDLAVLLYNPDGTRVNSFGTDGKLNVDIGGAFDSGWGVAVDSAGRIVLGGTTTVGGATAVAAVRLHPANGALDTTFDGDGIATVAEELVRTRTAVGGGVFVEAADAVSVGGGWTSGSFPSHSFQVARFTADGSRDSTFSTGRREGSLVDFAPAPGGKFLVASSVFAVSRYNADGTEDRGFGEDQNTASLPGGDSARDITILPDGGALIASSLLDDISLTRYTAGGEVDTSFGTNGRVIAELPQTNADPEQRLSLSVSVIEPQPGGRFLVAGTLFDPRGPGVGAGVIRFNADGSLDTTFAGGEGVLRTFGSDDSGFSGLRVLPDGKFILVDDYAHFFYFYNRYNADGTDDPGFQGFHFDPGDRQLLFGPIIEIAPDGKLVGGGTDEDTPDGDEGPTTVLFRLNTDGTLDTSFSGDGLLVDLPDGTAGDEVPGDARLGGGAAVQADGKILRTFRLNLDDNFPPATGDVGVMRFTASGAIDTTFGDGGTVVLDFGGVELPAGGPLIQSDGRILVAARRLVPGEGFGDQDTPLDLGFARLDADGSPDSSFGDGGAVVHRFDSGERFFGFGPITGNEALVLRTLPFGSTGFTSTNGFAVSQLDLSSSPGSQTPYHGSPFTIGAAGVTIQAEDYDLGGQGIAYHDTDSVNDGGQYRPGDGVDIMSHGSGLYRVGGPKAGEWMEYTIHVQEAGEYELEFRVSQSAVGATFHAEVNGVDVTGSVAAPNTGSFNTFTSVTETVTLAAGQHVLRLAHDANASNGYAAGLDWVKLTRVAEEPDQQPFHGGPFTIGATPVTIQAEDYDLGGEGVSYHDTDSKNDGGQYRPTDGVDIMSHGSGLYRVGGPKAGEWLEYTIDVQQAGDYELEFRVSQSASGAQFHAEVNGADVTGPIIAPNTGSFNTFTSVTQTVSLAAGTHVLRLAQDTNAANGYAAGLDSIHVTRIPDEPAQQPFHGAPFVIGDAPVTIQAEDYDTGGEGIAYNDTDGVNDGGQYRPGDGVDIMSHGSGLFRIGGPKAGEWMEYTLDVQEGGDYRLEFRVSQSASEPGARFHAEVDGVDVTGSLVAPDTNSFNIFTGVTSQSVSLTAGQHVLRVVQDTNASNGYAAGFDWIRVAPVTPAGGSIEIVGGTLTARGTDGADVIATERTGVDNVIVRVNTLAREFDIGDFTGLLLEGLGGDDTFNLIDPLVSPVVRNTTVLGGAGHDSLDYSARTTALRFEGYDDAQPGTNEPFVAVVSGAQEDWVDMTVERFIGGSGDDFFNINNATLFDEVFHDLTLEGRGGNDRFVSATFMRATMHGGAGDDGFFCDESASDTIYGGDGNDIVGFNSEGGPDFLDAGAGIDTITLYGSHREVIDIRPFIGLENVEGAGSNGASRTVIGNSLNNHITAIPHDPVTLHGLGGNDTLIGGEEGDLLDGGDGDDSLVGGFGDDTLDGGAGTDIADGGPGTNTYLNAEIIPAAPSIGIVGRVLIADGSWGQDLITIERIGTDDVTVRVNEVSRRFDMDHFDGVLLRGNAGYDDLRVIDAITAGSLTRQVTLEGGDGNDSLTGSSGEEVIRGGEGNDTLLAEAGADALFGGGGNDFLVGGTGEDFMEGGDADDFLDARDGAAGDTALGGNGNDTAQIDSGDEASNIETFV